VLYERRWAEEELATADRYAERDHAGTDGGEPFESAGSGWFREVCRPPWIESGSRLDRRR